MPAHKPEEAHTLFEEAFNAGDLNALVALYEPEAVTFDSRMQLVKGSQAIREALQGFLAWKPQIKLETKSVIQAGELALLRGEWQMKGTGAPMASRWRSHTRAAKWCAANPMARGAMLSTTLSALIDYWMLKVWTVQSLLRRMNLPE